MKSFMFRMLFAFMLSLTVPAMAAPGLVHYQGRLTNPSGQPITTPFDITFTFWDAETSGTQLGSGFSDADTVTPDASGIYSTLIGDDPSNLIPASVFAGNSVWLKVQINGENLTPRKRIVSVGYALRADMATTATYSPTAGNADKLDGKDSSAFAATAHNHAAGNITSGMFSDALVTNTLTVSALGSVDGGAIKSGTVAAARIDAAIARDSEILPAVLAGDGTGSTLDADKLDGKESSAFAVTAHAHKAGDITSGMFSDALVTDTLSVSLLGSVNGGAIKSGTVAAARIDAAIARDSEILPAVLAGDGTGSTLDADMLDGQHAAAFMAAASDNWVNTTGDTMTGALTVTGSPSTLVNVTNSSAVGGVRAIQGTASGIGAVVNFGGYFGAAGGYGRGVYGYASAEGAVANYGGYFTAAGDYGNGIFGFASATGAFANHGGFFQAAGNWGRGVEGYASATGALANNYGGVFQADGDTGSGVHGLATATGLVANMGGLFEAAGDNGRGVSGVASGAYGTGIQGDATATGAVANYGGVFNAAGNMGRGVSGTASGSSGLGVYGYAYAEGAVTNCGGRFLAAGDSGRGVEGYASATRPVINYGGYFSAAGSSGRGVYGIASGASGTGVEGYASATGVVTNYGGYFKAAGGNGIGVYGIANDRGVEGFATATGNRANIGGNFEAAGDNGLGVYGVATATGDVYNIGGVFSAAGDNGIGVEAVAWGTSGTAVYGTGKLYNFYAGGTGIDYGSFTGAHDVQIDAGFPADPKPGLIVVTAGPSKVRRDESGQVSISSTLPTVRLADRPNDKAVFGVLVREMPLPKDHWHKPAAGARFGAVNALGEGRVWVCSAAGPIEMGDYITTSAVPGYGQNQHDDTPRAWTVGKVIESVDWDTVTETIEHDGQVYKVYLIAVVYTCG